MAGAESQRGASDWRQVRTTFASIVAGASGVANMLDQEKRHILGLSEAVAQIDDSFTRLHSRFNEIEDRVAAFESLCGRLSYRLEATCQALDERNTNEAEMITSQVTLQAAVDSAERKVAEHGETIRALSEENRSLRDTIAAVERDGRFIVDEIGRMRNEIATLGSDDEAASASEAQDADDEQPPTVQAADVRQAPAEPVETPEPAPVVAETAPASGETELDELIDDITRSIDFHKAELARMQAQAETLLGRATRREVPAPAPPKPTRQDAIAAARAASEKKLAEIKLLSSSYQALVQDLEKSRESLIEPSPVSQDAAPEAPPQAAQQDYREEEPAEAAADEPQDELPDEVLEARSAAEPEPEPAPEPVAVQPFEPPVVHRDPLNPMTEFSKINSIRATYEKRTEELKAELMQERRERQFAESSLQVSRAERLQLQRELAKYRAMSWRRISPDGEPEPRQPQEPDGVRRITAA